MAKKLETLSSGRGIQVVNTGEEHTFVLEEAALAELLLREDVRERAVVVVSVAGAFRKGKSFLLDFFLRYMHHKYYLGKSGDWLGGEEEPLQGFSWRGGCERHTTGIHFWSQPFFATLEDGQKVVILLMDTQGTFDSESTVRDNATVFALSTMLSSVQIYNLSQNIEEDDLQHLQLFADYGRLAQESDGSVRPFQRLQLLVRDWSWPDSYPYGRDGGRKLLDDRLEIRETRHEQLNTLRSFITSCFSEIACFLLPHPGLKVATDPHFEGKLADIDPTFKEHLRQLVPMLLAPENLVMKKIHGQKVKAKDLLQYFKSYMKVFNDDKMPEPKTILEATAEANNLTAVSSAKEVYTKIMEEVCGGGMPYLEPTLLKGEHGRARDKAIHDFHSKKKMGGDEHSKKYGEQLMQELDEQLDTYLSNNEGKNVFKFAGTAMVFVSVVLLGYLVGAVGAALGVQSVTAAGEALAFGALGLLIVWAYSRISGNLRDIGLRIDAFAGTLRNYMFRQFRDSYGPRAAAAATAFDDKQKRP